MNLADLQKEAYAIAKEKGWWDEEPTFGDLIALVHSELSEALEAYRTDPDEPPMDTDTDGRPMLYWDPIDEEPIGVASKLADVVIRVADMAEWYGIDLDEVVAHLTTDYAPESMSFGDDLCVVHLWLSAAYGSHHQGNWVTRNSELGRVIVGVQAMAAHYGIDLDAAIKAKITYNRGCEYPSEVVGSNAE